LAGTSSAPCSALREPVRLNAQPKSARPEATRWLSAGVVTVSKPRRWALRYWNKARQRNCYSLARYCSGLRVSADRAANRAAHTRAKGAVLALPRPGLCETQTLRWRGVDSNFRFRDALSGADVNRPRAADDFAPINARMEELRREREGTRPSQKEAQRDLLLLRGGAIRWPQRSARGQVGSANQHKGNDGCGGLLNGNSPVRSPLLGLPGPRARNRNFGVLRAGTASRTSAYVSGGCARATRTREYALIV
jgi:hypothetical protein